MTKPLVARQFRAAFRHFHASSRLAQSAVNQQIHEPVTSIAQRESNQYSLEHPRNKAGMF